VSVLITCFYWPSHSPTTILPQVAILRTLLSRPVDLPTWRARSRKESGISETGAM
jgi:hypothetical protein